MKPRERRGRVSRRGRERQVRVRMLVAVAVGISSAVMAGLSAQAIVARNSCNQHPLLLNVATSLDITPAMQQVGRLFNGQNHQADGRCVEVQVSQDPPAEVAARVDGQASSAGLPAIDAWIPDSSLWVDVARAYPLGAQAVQPTGVHVARSPLVIVMPQPAAAQVAAFNNSVSWNFLLPEAVGGPSTGLGLRLSLPDPTQSAVGLAALVEISRLLGGSPAARTEFTKFVFGAQPSAQFDDTPSLTAFTTLAAPPLDVRPVTVTTEQAVVAYDATHHDQPLAARYPTGPSVALGTPELDYPFVMTSTDPAEQAAAREFAATLEQSYTASLVRYEGFRSGDGVPAAVPAADGLAQQPLQLAPPPGAGEAQTDLQAWQRLQVGSRDLVLLDVSSAMLAPSGLPNLTLEQMLTQVTNLGLALFPDSTQMGDWEFASNLTGSLPYKVLIPIGPLPAQVGLISRRQQLQQINDSVSAIAGAPAEINRTILAGYKEMLASYKPNFSNVLIVITAGVDKARGDLPANVLISRLRALYNPDRRVEVIITKVGTAGNYPILQKIAAAAGGAAYQISDPTQVVQEFFTAVARRICQGTGGCA